MTSQTLSPVPAPGAVPPARAQTHARSYSQWQLIARRLKRHRLAVWSLYILTVLYFIAIFAEFFAPYTPAWRDLSHAYCPPQPPRLSFEHGLHVYALERHVDPVTFVRTYTENRAQPIPLGFFVKGEPYELWGLIPCSVRFFGVDMARYRAASPAGWANSDDGTAAVPTFYLLGADKHGRDLLTRVLYGSRISLSVGLVSIFVTFIFGLVIGGISGYVGGHIDNVIQRIIEIINAFPQIPLWLGLAAAMPAEWSPLRTYFGITIVLSLLGWTGLARVVRGKLLALREEDYATAARLLGASHSRIIFRHLLPNFTSHIIVSLTLSIPGMILGETSLSFLGLGLRPPVVSWGVMLQDCLSMQVVASYPWLLVPVIFIVLTVLSFNFLGDGLRDAADPYSAR